MNSIVHIIITMNICR